MSTCFADRLQRYSALTARERTALEKLEDHPRQVARGSMVRRDHGEARELFILASGWTYSQVALDDGSRQILRVNLPGDLIGSAAIAYSNSGEAIVALTNVVVCPFDKAALRALYVDHPRIAALIHMLTVEDQVAFADRLTSIGRTSAKSRIAALILDTLVRLRRSRGDALDKLPLLLTQEEIGDATGLTAVHVNRMLRALDEEGLVMRTAGHVVILDEPRLRRVARYVDRYASLDTGWLPASRD